jgi:hypothetical protein
VPDQPDVQGVTMNPRAPKPVIISERKVEPPAPSLRSIIRKSALLNVVIVLTSFPVLVFAGGPKAVIPALKIMAGISVLIWTATFALFSLVTFPRLFRTPASLVTPSDPPHPANEARADDRWLDGPP